MYHPDHNPDGQEHFENISEAYQVLGDPDLRRLYDQQSIMRPLYTPTAPNISHEDIKETPMDNSNVDIRHNISCTLEDLYNGNSKKRFAVKRKIFCDSCTYKSRSTCEVCDGKNSISQKRVIKLDLKKGMKSGQSIVFSGDGDQYVSILLQFVYIRLLGT
jgi:DnaJ family protein A protein 2